MELNINILPKMRLTSPKCVVNGSSYTLVDFIFISIFVLLVKIIYILQLVGTICEGNVYIL